MENLYLTRKGLKNLDDKLIVHEEKTRELLRQLGETCVDDPDLPENLLSKEIRTKFQGELPAEKRRLLGMKAAAIMVEGSEEFLTKPQDVVWIGSEVSYCNINNRTDIETLIILGALESDVMNSVISYEAPIAKAMMNKKAGDVFNLNNDTDESFEIISVKRVLAAEE